MHTHELIILKISGLGLLEHSFSESFMVVFAIRKLSYHVTLKT